MSRPALCERPRNFRKIFYLLSIGLLTTVPARADLPPGWSGADIGSPGLAGSAGHTNGNWTVRGGGADIWGTSDQFQYAYTTASGDSTIIARVTSLQNTDA